MITVNLYYTGVDANARKFAEEMKKAVRRIGSARKRVTCDTNTSLRSMIPKRSC